MEIDVLGVEHRSYAPAVSTYVARALDYRLEGHGVTLPAPFARLLLHEDLKRRGERVFDQNCLSTLDSVEYEKK